MGVLPNVAAAIAIPFVLLSIWADQKPAATYRAARRSFVILTLIAGVGLIAWEFMQQSSHSLFFDYHDIAATIFGLVVAWLLFLVLTPEANSTAA
jgi:glycopeptide antibiotics resistance protein